jgi:hypothetical protein
MTARDNAKPAPYLVNTYPEILSWGQGLRRRFKETEELLSLGFSKLN